MSKNTKLGVSVRNIETLHHNQPIQKMTKKKKNPHKHEGKNRTRKFWLIFTGPGLPSTWKWDRGKGEKLYGITLCNVPTYATIGYKVENKALEHILNTSNWYFLPSSFLSELQSFLRYSKTLQLTFAPSTGQPRGAIFADPSPLTPLTWLQGCLRKDTRSDQ